MVTASYHLFVWDWDCDYLVYYGIGLDCDFCDGICHCHGRDRCHGHGIGYDHHSDQDYGLLGGHWEGNIYWTGHVRVLLIEFALDLLCLIP